MFADDGRHRQADIGKRRGDPEDPPHAGCPLSPPASQTSMTAPTRPPLRRGPEQRVECQKVRDGGPVRQTQHRSRTTAPPRQGWQYQVGLNSRGCGAVRRVAGLEPGIVSASELPLYGVRARSASATRRRHRCEDADQRPSNGVWPKSASAIPSSPTPSWRRLSVSKTASAWPRIAP